MVKYQFVYNYKEERCGDECNVLLQYLAITGGNRHSRRCLNVRVCLTSRLPVAFIYCALVINMHMYYKQDSSFHFVIILARGFGSVVKHSTADTGIASSIPPHANYNYMY